MKRSIILLAAAGIAVAATALAQQAVQPPSIDGLMLLGQPVTAEQVAAGRTLYGENCASCHGVNLEGQPDWKRRLENGRMPAPPHDATGHTWHHSDRALFDITKGSLAAVVPGYESDMPAFGDKLTDAEIVALLSFIKSTWPERERDYQAEITARDQPSP